MVNGVGAWRKRDRKTRWNKQKIVKRVELPRKENSHESNPSDIIKLRLILSCNVCRAVILGEDRSEIKDRDVALVENLM